MADKTKRTQSLSYPSDPLAAIRALQELDPVPQRGPETRKPPAAAGSDTTPQVARATGSEVGSAPSSGPVPPEKIPPKPNQTGPRRKEQKPEAQADPEGKSPMELAIVEMLQKPYSADAGKGPYTVTTVKIPTEVWERLGWASTLKGQTKQEIISEALRGWLADAAKGR